MSSILSLSQLFLADAGDAAGAGVAAGAGIIMIIVWAIVLLGSIFVIWMLVDCLTSSLPTNEKILWVLVIIFLHLLGALIYFFVKRSGARGPRVAA